MNKPKHHVFVCSSSRITGQQRGYCVKNDSVEIIQRFMMGIEEEDLTGDVMVTNTGCLGICDKGPIVIIYPEGVWYGSVSPDDVAEIIQSHLVGGKVVESLKI
ncbi:(2Fe-2S) ferredoxin domain-containing protein [Iocasia frigidifontis]|uniref:(2Fe-2S) ferredoxin domain-containing protein n=1 Tax=Iocasia fonsfrigidae TaxID=2682810 RepID=A0A8A7K6V3_9FIRM|nr:MULTISPECIES: 2Fe-2S ferredoxin [Halanaerobiaceae]AZO94202.1 (2Fe-2S) ferredoxin domain-containing protein [Halocella sp. SP3-1]QTL97121.1 (2Fe-2S) ferredoxin domain-containing protein [Iocasia fonsfrigidae]